MVIGMVVRNGVGELINPLTGVPSNGAFDGPHAVRISAAISISERPMKRVRDCGDRWEGIGILLWDAFHTRLISGVKHIDAVTKRNSRFVRLGMYSLYSAHGVHFLV